MSMTLEHGGVMIPKHTHADVLKSGKEAWLRAMCGFGRSAGSIPVVGVRQRLGGSTHVLTDHASLAQRLRAAGSYPVDASVRVRQGALFARSSSGPG